MRWGNPWLALIVFPANAVLLRVAGSSLPVIAVGCVLFVGGLIYAVKYSPKVTLRIPGIRRRAS